MRNPDQNALIQLALDANKQNNSAASIAYLRDAVFLPDASAIAHYLLGAEYAQAQMYDRAIAQMESAVSLDSSLTIAYLQLGLLRLTSGESALAEECFLPLQELPTDNPLHQFGKGLTHLIHDQFVECREYLSHGITLNIDNPALNADMQKILAEIEKLSSAEISASKENEQESGQHVLLSVYANKNEH